MTTKPAPAKKTGDVELTEMTEIKASRYDGVKSAASGYPVLMLKALDGSTLPADVPSGCGCCSACMSAEKGLSEALSDEDRERVLAAIKAVNEDGEVDETADIGTAEQILVLLAKLIASEASEMATGQWDESYDIMLLTEAVSAMKCFLRCEQAEKGTAASDLDEYEAIAKAEETILDAAEVDVYKRKVSAAERKQLASEGNALSDGSYPIANSEDLHNAAVLARSGHGDVAAAKRLIAKRARELGVTNPLTDHDTSKASGETPGNDGNDALLKRIEALEADKAEAEKASEKRIEALEATLAKVLETPIPGGPFITAPLDARKSRAQEQRQVEAARMRRLATEVDDPDLKSFYKERARELAGEEES